MEREGRIGGRRILNVGLEEKICEKRCGGEGKIKRKHT